MYNARREKEAARLMKEWEDALAGVWIPAELVEKIEDTGEQYLVGQYKLAFLKGKKFVPILVPIDLINAL